MYTNQPLIYVANNNQQQAIEAMDNYNEDASVIFNGGTKIIKTHGVEFYCTDNSSAISNINTSITNIINRLDNLDGGDGYGQNKPDLESRVKALETLLQGPADENSNDIADFIEQLNSIRENINSINNTIITIVNNNLADIEFWYTYPEQVQ